MASRIAPGWSDPEYKLGLAFMKKGDRLKAKEHFEKFLSLEPKTERSALVKKALEDLEKKRPPVISWRNLIPMKQNFFLFFDFAFNDVPGTSWRSSPPVPTGQQCSREHFGGKS
jgi:hypothetical protein